MNNANNTMKEKSNSTIREKDKSDYYSQNTFETEEKPGVTQESFHSLGGGVHVKFGNASTTQSIKRSLDSKPSKPIEHNGQPKQVIIPPAGGIQYLDNIIKQIRMQPDKKPKMKNLTNHVKAAASEMLLKS